VKASEEKTVTSNSQDDMLENSHESCELTKQIE